MEKVTVWRSLYPTLLSVFLPVVGAYIATAQCRAFSIGAYFEISIVVWRPNEAT